MPSRLTKDDIIFEKTQFSGKIMMYNSPTWDVLFPIVDIIRLLRKNTIISTKCGKGQNIIRTYGSQYDHRILSYDFKNKDDYLKNILMVKTIFIFSDSNENFVTNLLTLAKKNKINVVCYSTIDSVYHFYDYTNDKKYNFKEPSEVVEQMYLLFEYFEVKKIAELFSDFEIIPLEDTTKKSSLEECMEALSLKNKELKEKKDKLIITKIPFDPNLAKLKKMEYERSQKNRKFDETPPTVSEKETPKSSGIFNFFKMK